MAWKGESRRHSLARKGVKTVVDQGKRFDVSTFVARGNDEEKSSFYKQGFAEGEYSAEINLAEDQQELFDAYENDELGEIAGQVRDVASQYAGDISYDVRFFDEDIDVLDWLNESDDMKLFDEDYAVEQVMKKFNRNESDAERIVNDWKSGRISYDDFEEWENGFYDGFNNEVRLAYIDNQIMAIYDNGGETADRYSIIFKDGDVVGMNDMPFHATYGFSQYAGNIHQWGLKTFDHLGKKIEFRSLNEDVQKAIEQRLGD